MSLARVFTAAAGCVVLGASIASCSGSFGSGTGLPNTAPSPNFGATAAPTPASQSSVILTYGESTSFQTLPEVGGYSGAVAFPKAPAPTAAPSPKGKAAKNATPEPAPTPVAVSIGVTLSIVKPQDGPDLNFVSGKGRRRKNRELPARALAYITLLPTHDATLESFPRFELDVPREVASQYRDGEFGLALWNSGEKDSKYRLAVAELDMASTPPPIARAVASVPTAAASAGASAKPGAASGPTMKPGPPPPGASPSPAATGAASPGTIVAGGTGTLASAAPVASPTLPPARILFAGTAATLKLVANRPAVFALYALPHPASPAPKAASGSPAPKAASGSSAPKAGGSAAPATATSPHPAESAGPAAPASPSASATKPPSP